MNTNTQSTSSPTLPPRSARVVGTSQPPTSSDVRTRQQARSQSKPANSSPAPPQPSRQRQTSEAARRAREKARQLNQSQRRAEERQRRSSELQQLVPEVHHTGDTTEEDDSVEQTIPKSILPPSRQPRTQSAPRPATQVGVDEEDYESASSLSSGGSPKRKAILEHRAASERHFRHFRPSPSEVSSADAQPSLKGLFTASRNLRSVQSYDGLSGTSFVDPAPARTCDIKQCPLLVSLGFGHGCSKAHYDRIKPAGLRCIGSTQERKDWVHAQVHAWEMGKKKVKHLMDLQSMHKFAKDGLVSCGEGWDIMLKEGWERVWCGEEVEAVPEEEDSENKENGAQPLPAQRAAIRDRGVLNVLEKGELTFEVPGDDAPPSPRRAEPVAQSASSAFYHRVERHFDIWQSPPFSNTRNTQLYRDMMARHPGTPL